MSVSDVAVESAGLPDLDLAAIFPEDSAPLGVDGVAFQCQRPHWKVSRDAVKRILQIVLSFPANAVVFLAVWREGGVLRVHANNNDAVIDSELGFLNDDPYDSGDRVFFLESDKLLAFISSYDQFVFSFDDKGDIHYESAYVFYRLETVSVALKDVRVPLEDVSGKWVKFPLTRGEVGVLKTLYGFAVRVSDSKILFDGGKAEAFFTLYKYTVYGKMGIDERVVVRRLDLPVIYELASDEVWMAFTDSRIYFKSSLGVVSFLRVPYTENAFMYPESFAQGGEIGRFRFEIPLIRRALKLTALLGADAVTFRQDGDVVYMVVSNCARFEVGKGSTQEFDISLDIFSKVLSTVVDGDVHLNVVVTERGMDLDLEKGMKIVYSLSRTSVAQLVKEDRAAALAGPGGKPAAAPVVQAPVMPSPGKALAAEFEDQDIF